MILLKIRVKDDADEEYQGVSIYESLSDWDSIENVEAVMK